MENNPFWIIVKELYPTFLQLLFLYGIFRMVKGIWGKIGGNEEAISLAIQNIIEAFFWAHLSIPLVTAIYFFTENLGNALEPAFKILGGS